MQNEKLQIKTQNLLAKDLSTTGTYLDQEIQF